MLSRDTRVHTVALFLAIAVAVAADYANVSAAGPLSTEGPLAIALAVVAYGLVFGGAHLYLAVRHDDGLVPAESRWRYVSALSVVLIAAVVIGVGGDRSLGPASVATVGFGVIALTTVGYLLVESTAGYRASRTEQPTE